MPLFLDTSGNSTLGIGICARCSSKFPLEELSPDRNSPGLLVCKDDNDELDPYRLPARQPDAINLPFTRPDVPLGVPPSVLPQISVSQEDAGDPVLITWTPAEIDGGPPGGYNVYVSVNGGEFSLLIQLPSNVTTYSDGAVYPDGSELVYYVTAPLVEGVPTFNDSDQESITYDAAPPPAPPLITAGAAVSVNYDMIGYSRFTPLDTKPPLAPETPTGLINDQPLTDCTIRALVDGYVTVGGGDASGKFRTAGLYVYITRSQAFGAIPISLFSSLVINGKTYLTADCADGGGAGFFNTWNSAAAPLPAKTWSQNSGYGYMERIWFWPIQAGFANGVNYQGVFT